MTLFTRRSAGGRCPCGAEHAACGPPSTAVPVDQRIEEVAAVGGPLKKYRVTSPTGVETVMKLNEADAEARGLSNADVVSGRGGDAVLSLPDDDHAPTEGQDGGEPGSGDGEGQAPEKKARATAANKARTSSANKGRTPRAKGGAGGGD